MNLVFATRNENKIREIQNLVGPSVRLLSLSDIGFHEIIEEPYHTFEENARCKAQLIYARCGVNCFADDSGLEVDALQGAPGVLSSRYADEEGPFLNEQDRYDANIRKILKSLEGVKDRKARFRTVIVLIIQGKEFVFEGVADGWIINEPRGKEGFGYDPVFRPKGYSRSFAEMSLREKNRISHRAKAFRQLAAFLANEQNYSRFLL